MRTNIRVGMPGQYRTHEGAPAAQVTPLQALRRSVLAHLLWEGEFYEDGQHIVDRIVDNALLVGPKPVAQLAVEAREVYKLRHVPLLLCSILARIGKGTSLPSETIERVIQRTDELAELIAVHAKWQGVAPVWAKRGHDQGLKKALPAQMKKGIARAFTKFDAYGLAKYNRDNAIKLKDVLFMTHPKPRDAEQQALWESLINGTMAAPDTWEVALSTGADAKETWTRLLTEGPLGYLALLRNLRNMEKAGVDEELIARAILARKGARKVLPFRFIAAVKAAPMFSEVLDKALVAQVEEMPVLPGKTLVLVDVSGSMDYALSGKSQMRRLEAASVLASIIPGQRRVFTFSERLVEVPARLGLAGCDAIIQSQPHQSTYLGRAVEQLNGLPHDRLIVLTDEQSHDRVPNPKAKHAYMVNIASNENGVGYRGGWQHLDGFSEGVLRWIAEYEKEVW